MTNLNIRRARLMGCTALVVAGFLPAAAWAQGQTSGGGLEEIVVTAQKREQSVQDVPIAVTAVTEATLQANRITNVNDLGSIAPGVTVRPSAGGIQTPFFTIRGQQSAGVVAGSDKQVSIYLDGIYLASPRGSIFDLPDIARLEVLRGPQGTLFGRNATAGAVSVVTKDPSGEFHFKVEGTVANQGGYRVRASVETPQVGPFSALFSYVRNYRHGDIQNLAEGVFWDRSAVGYGTATSPKWLGTTDTNSYFAAVKFESGDFKTVYKFDRNDDHGTPEGTAVLAYANLDGAGLLRNALIVSGVPLDSSGLRPDAVNNGFVVPRQQRVFGHSVTSTWRASDEITVKNIFAYRKADVFSPTSIDGLGGLPITSTNARAFGKFYAVITPPAYGGLGGAFFALLPAQQDAIGDAFGTPLIGRRYANYVSQATSIAQQWSDELQLNYTTEKLNATVGALWFHSKEESGGPPGQKNSPSVNLFPADGTIGQGSEGRSFNTATSLAAYVQLEYKITPTIELVGGFRITNDKKQSSFRFDAPSFGLGTTTIAPPDYSKTRPSWLLGVNWRPAADTLLYFKYSNSFVTGGTTYGINYEPEIASSFEIGAKADFFDHRLRTNLAVYTVDYKNLQQSQSPAAAQSSKDTCHFALDSIYGVNTANALCGPANATSPSGAISTFIGQIGTLRSRGFELEVTAAPTRGMTVGGSIAYTHTEYFDILPSILAANLGTYLPTYRPPWTGNFFVSYETQPLFADATVQLRVDGLYQSKMRFDSHSRATAALIYAPGSDVRYENPAYMLLNGRLALKHVKVGPAEAEIAVWSKNMTDRKETQFPLFLGAALGTSITFIPARSFGMDVSINF